MALYLMPVFGGGDEVENVDLYFLNAGYGNQDTAPILASIREHDPEFINIVELSEGLATSIKELGYLPKYEHFNKYDSLGWYVHPRWKNKTAQE